MERAIAPVPTGGLQYEPGRPRMCPMCRDAEMRLLDRPVPYELLICPKCQTVVSNFQRVAARGAFPAS